VNSRMKALIVYGTRWGGTVAVAEKIGDELKKAGWTVDVADARSNVPAVAGYYLVVVGSGVRADQWTKETLVFLEKNAEALREKKTALFVSCSMAERKENDVREKARETYLPRVAERFGLKPMVHGFFGGYMNMKQSHGLLADLIVKVNWRNLRRHGLNTVGVTDNRDWAAIEAWAIEVSNAAQKSERSEGFLPAPVGKKHINSDCDIIL
jgi:menaquinone-dependent protoporphyrinogen IX oxidase